MFELKRDAFMRERGLHISVAQARELITGAERVMVGLDIALITRPRYHPEECPAKLTQQ